MHDITLSFNKATLSSVPKVLKLAMEESALEEDLNIALSPIVAFAMYMKTVACKYFDAQGAIREIEDFTPKYHDKKLDDCHHRVTHYAGGLELGFIAKDGTFVQVQQAAWTTLDVAKWLETGELIFDFSDWIAMFKKYFDVDLTEYGF